MQDKDADRKNKLTDTAIKHTVCSANDTYFSCL